MIYVVVEVAKELLQTLQLTQLVFVYVSSVYICTSFQCYCYRKWRIRWHAVYVWIGRRTSCSCVGTLLAANAPNHSGNVTCVENLLLNASTCLHDMCACMLFTWYVCMYAFYMISVRLCFLSQLFKINTLVIV